MDLEDYQERPYFTPFQLEYILQIPLTDVVELFAKTARVSEPRGCYEGDACRAVIAQWARKRVYVELIARNAANATPEVIRHKDCGTPHDIGLRDVTNERVFSVRFPGDLRRYLDTLQPAR